MDHLAYATNKSRVGGKGWGLSQLMQAGIPGLIIPRTVVIYATDTLDDLRANLERRPRGGIFASTPFPVAVRSSGVAEDGESASFAGQYDTFLNVEEDGLINAVEKCRASGAAADDYRTAAGAAAAPIAVLVQDMVKATMAGVVFTGRPSDGNSNVMVVEYVEGLGDDLVAGRVMPTGSYDYDLRTKSVTRSTGAPWSTKLDGVVALGQQISSYFHQPTDIEWAIDDRGILYTLQARPITGVDVWSTAEIYGRGGGGVGVGPAKWMPKTEGRFKKGSVLLAKMTDPRMVREMIASVGIATELGGRTCHAAIVARELKRPCVVGCGPMLSSLTDGVDVVVDADAGEVYAKESMS